MLPTGRWKQNLLESTPRLHKESLGFRVKSSAVSEFSVSSDFLIQALAPDTQPDSFTIQIEAARFFFLKPSFAMCGRSLCAHANGRITPGVSDVDWSP